MASPGTRGKLVGVVLSEAEYIIIIFSTLGRSRCTCSHLLLPTLLYTLYTVQYTHIDMQKKSYTVHLNTREGQWIVRNIEYY